MESACTTRISSPYQQFSLNAKEESFVWHLTTLQPGFTLVFKSNCNFEQLISLFGYFVMFARTDFQKLDDGERFVQSRSG